MPSLELDVTDRYSTALKRALAQPMSEQYARTMSVDIRRISVAIREMGEGGVWIPEETGRQLVPVSVMMLDIPCSDVRGPPEARSKN